MSSAATLHDLESLVLSYHPIVACETVEEQRVVDLLVAACVALSVPLYEWSITEGMRRHGALSTLSNTEDPLILLRYLQGENGGGVYLLKDFAVHLNSPKHCRAFRDVASAFSSSRSTIVLSGDPIELPRDIEQLTVRLNLALPDRQELKQLVQNVVQSLATRIRFDIRLTTEDLDGLVRALTGLTLSQARQAIAFAIVEDHKLNRDDIRKIIDHKGKMIESGGVLEFRPWEQNAVELGGFEKLKAWLETSRAGYTAEAQRIGLTPPRGAMIVGMPGCGKSLAAKFIARQWQLPLLKLDAGRLYEKYIGETEKNFRKAIALAESMAPCIFWIDEIEKMFSVSGSGESDAGLSQRMFGSFLTWLQEKNSEVFVVGVANDLMRVPPELLRKGRFDQLFFVDLPDERERRTIFEIHLALRKQSPQSFDLDALVSAADGFSGAEIEQAVIAALYRSLHEKCSLNSALLEAEVSSAVPLSRSRSEDLERIRDLARGRFVSVH
ncbi:MAG: AAA family ATPase [Acidobacteriota bacterium]